VADPQNPIYLLCSGPSLEKMSVNVSERHMLNANTTQVSRKSIKAILDVKNMLDKII